MTVVRFEKLTWALIFAGLAVIGLGWSVPHTDGVLAWALMAGGAVALAAGALMVWLRSRMKDGA